MSNSNKKILSEKSRKFFIDGSFINTIKIKIGKRFLKSYGI